MFQPPPGRSVVIRCKGCLENIPAPVETMPAQPIAAKCPLCGEHRRYLPSEVFQGRLSHMFIRKPVMHSRWPGGEMTPRFKGVPNFDLSQPCPLCGYNIQPWELVRLASEQIKCPGCGEVFNEMGGRKRLSMP